jgi:uncharacterized protein (TIRG00374 family)
VVAVAFAWALPSFAAYRDVIRELTDLDRRPATALVVTGSLNLVAPALVHRSSVPGLRLDRAVAADWATTAVTNTVPGGSALAVGLTWRMYRSWGIERRAIARSVMVTGVWDTFVKLGTPLLALLWLSSERPVDRTLINATVIGGVLFTVMLGLGAVLLAGPATSSHLGHFLDRLPFPGGRWSERLANLRSDTMDLLRRRWWSLTFWSVAGHANLFLLLVVCLRAVGIDADQLTPAAVLAAFAFGRLVSAIPVTPGGLGVLEVGLTGALATVGNAPEAAVVAAVLLFRFCTFLAPIPLGAVTWLAWSTRETADASGTDPGDDGAGIAEPARPEDTAGTDGAPAVTVGTSRRGRG